MDLSLLEHRFHRRELKWMHGKLSFRIINTISWQCYAKFSNKLYLNVMPDLMVGIPHSTMVFLWKSDK
jgi:hypothetical protein